MAFALNALGQVALGVDDVDRAEAFYAGVLGLRKLYRFGDLVFFDCAGVRLLVEKSRGHGVPAGVLYFRTLGIGFLATAYNFVPLMLNSRVERAYQRAVASVPGATGLVNVTYKEDWYWFVLGSARCVTVRGEAIR